MIFQKAVYKELSSEERHEFSENGILYLVERPARPRKDTTTKSRCPEYNSGKDSMS